MLCVVERRCCNVDSRARFTLTSEADSTTRHDTTRHDTIKVKGHFLYPHQLISRCMSARASPGEQPAAPEVMLSA